MSPGNKWATLARNIAAGAFSTCWRATSTSDPSVVLNFSTTPALERGWYFGSKGCCRNTNSKKSSAANFSIFVRLPACTAKVKKIILWAVLLWGFKMPFVVHPVQTKLHTTFWPKSCNRYGWMCYIISYSPFIYFYYRKSMYNPELISLFLSIVGSLLHLSEFPNPFFAS